MKRGEEGDLFLPANTQDMLGAGHPFRGPLGKNRGVVFGRCEKNDEKICEGISEDERDGEVKESKEKSSFTNMINILNDEKSINRGLEEIELSDDSSASPKTEKKPNK